MPKSGENRSAKQDEAPSRAVGRPTGYSEEIAIRVCEQIALGKSLATIFQRNDWCPAISSIYKWMTLHPEFAERYTKAKEDAADRLADEITDIPDQEPERDENGKIDNGWVNLQRLRVDTRKWIAAKLKPKKYGEKLEHTGEAASLTINLVSGVPQPKTIDISAETTRLPAPETP